MTRWQIPKHADMHKPWGSDPVISLNQPVGVATLTIGSDAGDTFLAIQTGLSATVPGFTTGVGFALAGCWTVGAGDGLAAAVFSNDDVDRSITLANGWVQTIGATTREQLNGSAVAVPAGSGFINVTWDTHVGGSTILDLTNPSTPAFINAGTYFVAVNINFS